VLQAVQLAQQKHREKQYVAAFEDIIRSLRKKDTEFAQLFLRPVDTQEYEDYLDVINNPISIMDMT
jgi:thioredoxin-like negative regulator of GroEL